MDGISKGCRHSTSSLLPTRNPVARISPGFTSRSLNLALTQLKDDSIEKLKRKDAFRGPLSGPEEELIMEATEQNIFMRKSHQLFMMSCLHGRGRPSPALDLLS
jgi:hypothetical protein